MTMVEDKRLCPHCGRELHRGSYLMSLRASTPVLSTRLVWWIVIAVVVLTVISFTH